MNKDTIYREDAIKAINLRVRIPHDVASAQYASMAINAICSVPSADRPQGDVDAVDIFEREMHNLEQGYITLGEFDKRIEPLRHLCYGKPQGEWIEVDDSLISCKCSICNWESHMHEDDVYGMPYCPNCGAHMKGTENNKECHKPESLYYRCYCDERKEDEYCNGCRFWYESQTERISK